jgi:hypothetical protein
MAHNRHTFSDRQLCCSVIKERFTSVDLSCTAVEQQAESKDENIYIVTCHFNSFQTANQMTEESFYFS